MEIIVNGDQIHPASTIFADFSIEQCLKMGVPGGLIRLSAGIEDVDDLIADLSQGFNTI